MELTITRDTVQSEDVIETSLDGGAVTDLKITGFSSSAADDVKKMLGDSLAAGVRRFVIDLRDDPGGFVGTAESIADQFIPSGPIYWEEDAKGNDTPHDASGDGVATDPGIAIVGAGERRHRQRIGDPHRRAPRLGPCHRHRNQDLREGHGPAVDPALRTTAAASGSRSPSG